MDTIFALATAQGKAGVAVIRISGPLAHDAGCGLAGSLPDRCMSRTRILRDAKGEILDHALVLRFDAPASFTGEDVVELQCHGSTAIVAAVLSELGDRAGLRLAEPGEFTRRALENGRLDLSQVEGLADLIDAETEAQRRQAQKMFSGALGDLAERWRKDLIRAAALIEATIDFADEDVPTDVTPEVSALLSGVMAELSAQTDGLAMAERIRNGFEVAIVGPPNVGKSTLLNYLAGRDAAITSEFAGTTRDVIEVRMDLGGLPVTLLDTAGLRETDDFVEGIGIDRAVQRAEIADLRVFLSDGRELLLEPRSGDIILHPMADRRWDKRESISGKTGEGVAELVARISQLLQSRSQSAGLATRMRHKTAMERALEALRSGQETLSRGSAHYDIAAEEMRTAIRALESLVGRIDVENLLDEIFASFCLGK
ncbi:tRNA uridine-5-carboxymethylaminomethyl(34) synthesis GTPase MnmE [Aestuariivita sp.]|jgi:tRNA modification GTPase|uniref:tRNA uridine-5-carboxymethylaminomethyl(34) synthesis GTPase MnmE n=1 Tax=Aestuariivita sp. TaxID=1872407 RepID=UPI00216F8C2F|nr:tRNA uridine-5-carboxymethylaminomethyl(34) synthesis GTPase MnmE [Aestuariivita sp.]MCE8005514.1 tRNA uridine-5-carboxymethylaminomethyl(34) synthesis GTPase MnmE [Aestuariivita sp.]